jgi:hypothetical protein
MFIEGIMDKAYKDLLVDAGYDVVWVCESESDALAHDYDSDAFTMAEESGDCIVRIFMDCNVEDILSPRVVCDSLDKKEILPLMAVSKNNELRKFAEEELRRG